MPRFFSHHQVDQAQRDGKKNVASYDHSCVAHFVSWLWFSWELHTYKSGGIIAPVTYVMTSNLVNYLFRYCPLFFVMWSLWVKWNGLRNYQLSYLSSWRTTSITFLGVVLAARIFVSQMILRKPTKWSLTASTLCESFMIKKMLLATHLNRLMLIYSVAVIMQLTRLKIITISPGWLIMSRRIMGCLLFSKILPRSSMEKVYEWYFKVVPRVLFPFLNVLIFWLTRHLGCGRRWWENRSGKCSVTWVWNKYCIRSLQLP